MRKVYKLVVYRKLAVPGAFGGRMSKETVGEFESKEAATAAYNDLKAVDSTVQSHATTVDWR